MSRYFETVNVGVENLLDSTENYTIESNEKGKYVDITINVAKVDMGKVIGKQGRIAKAIRTVVKAAAIKENKKVVVEII